MQLVRKDAATSEDRGQLGPRRRGGALDGKLLSVHGTISR